MLSALRNFALVFLISVAAFGVGAFFLAEYIIGNYSDGIFGPGGPGDDGYYRDDGDRRDDLGAFYRFTALIIGTDSGESQMDGAPEADTIILMDINSLDRTFMMSHLPRDTRVEARGYILRLGSVYAVHGAEALVNTVWALTGIRPDFYCVLDYGSVERIVDAFGGIEFDVPHDMLYIPRPHNYFELGPVERGQLAPEINLRRGRQTLDGRQAMQLLRFRNYGGGHASEEAARANMQKSFIREVIRQKFTRENIEDNLEIARELYEAVIGRIVATNMRLGDFLNYAVSIFGFWEYEPLVIEYPGRRISENGVEFFVPSHADAVRDFFWEHRRPPTPVTPGEAEGGEMTGGTTGITAPAFGGYDG